MKRFKPALPFLMAFVMFLQFQTTVAAVEDTGFTDIDSNAWYAGAVKYCAENSLMSGTSENTFSPDTSMSRAMLAAVLYRMAGSPPATGETGFSDAAQDTWYANAVTWAAQNEIMSGYTNGLFGTTDSVTREQLATILWRYARMHGRAVSEANDQPDSPAGASTTTFFSDGSAVPPYAVSAISWARGSGAVNGRPGNIFDTSGVATRAEVAAILWNYSSPEQPSATTQPVSAPMPQAAPEPVEDSGEESGMINISIAVGGSVFSAKLYDNDMARAFLSQLPLTLDMSELNGNEKYFYLSGKLPTAGEQVGSIKNGDLMLYGSDCLVLFYKSFSTSYSYTRLGYVDDPSGLDAALGNGSVQVTFAVKQTEILIPIAASFSEKGMREDWLRI